MAKALREWIKMFMACTTAIAVVLTATLFGPPFPFEWWAFVFLFDSLTTVVCVTLLPVLLAKDGVA